MILMIGCVLSFCSCGIIKSSKNDVKATVTTNQGTVEVLSAKELYNISEENGVRFNDVYWDAQVVVSGKINEIKGSHYLNGTYYKWAVVVEGGESDWFIGVNNYTETTITEDYLATLNVGDMVEASGAIVGASRYSCNISNGEVFITKK